jgi:hypothetical protein
MVKDGEWAFGSLLTHEAVQVVALVMFSAVLQEGRWPPGPA